MYKFLSDAEDNGFSWEMLGDVGSGRENLGASMPVLVYRLFQYTMRDVLNKEFGAKVGIDIFRKAGELAGSEFAKNVLDLTAPLNKFISELQGSLK
ncbi:MAG: 4-vinyl reductase, partial [Clostridiales bacterium]|nr:4-vinyl reductase [Clostridiales bacterium]